MTASTKPTIGERVKFAREERGMSQYMLAKRTGLSRPTIANIEQNKRCTNLMTFIAIAQVLDCSLDWLATLED